MWFTQVCPVSVTNVTIRDGTVSNAWATLCCSALTGQKWTSNITGQYSVSLNNSNNVLTTHLWGCLSVEKPVSVYKCESKENCFWCSLKYLKELLVLCKETMTTSISTFSHGQNGYFTFAPPCLLYSERGYNNNSHTPTVFRSFI